jgi:hypothetical protein
MKGASMTEFKSLNDYTARDDDAREYIFASYSYFKDIFRPTTTEEPLYQHLADLDTEALFYEFIENHLETTDIISARLKADLQAFTKKLRAVIDTHSRGPLEKFDDAVLSDERWPDVYAAGRDIVDQLESEIPTMIYDLH